MNERILKIYEETRNFLLKEFETEGACYFCKCLALAVVKVDTGIDVVYNNSEHFDLYHKAVNYVELHFSKFGDFSLLYSYKPESVWSAYWFDPEDYESRKMIIDDLLLKNKL